MSDPTDHSRRTAELRAAGVSRQQLRSQQWVNVARGVHRPADVEAEELALRLGDARALTSPGSAIGGWAALRLQGNWWFDGLDRRGRPRDVLVLSAPGSHQRSRPGFRPVRALVLEDETIDLGGFRVATMARAAFDEMRLAPNLREAVVALDMATSRTSKVPHTTPSRVAAVVGAHHKTRGLVMARRALDLGCDRSASPWETRTRLVAEIDAGLPRLLVNAPMFDLKGNLLGVADLLEEASGLVLESDGGDHRGNERHTDDNRREEKLERHGATVCRATALDHGERPQLVRRMRDAYRDARRETRRAWTLDKPDWWWSWPPGRQWDGPLSR